MKDVTVKSSLPVNATALAAGLATSASIAQTGGGGQLFLKMEKSGHWVYGTNADPVDPESVFAINPTSFQHGWICWGNERTTKQGTRLGQLMASATQPYPACPAAIEDGTWTQQFGFDLQGYEGEDADMELSWNGNSRGAQAAYGKLLQTVVTQITSGKPDFVPLVALETESYKHAKYGKIFNPLFNVVGWVTMDGLSAAPADDADDEPEPAPAPSGEPTPPVVDDAPVRRRRRA